MTDCRMKPSRIIGLNKALYKCSPFTIHSWQQMSPSDSCSCTLFHINMFVWRKRAQKYAWVWFDKSKYFCAYVLSEFCPNASCHYKSCTLFNTWGLKSARLLNRTRKSNISVLPAVDISFETEILGFSARWASSDCQLWSSNKRSFVQANFQFDSFSVATEVLTFCLKTAVLRWQKLSMLLKRWPFNSADMSFPSTPPLSDTQPLTAPCKKIKIKKSSESNVTYVVFEKSFWK